VRVPSARLAALGRGLGGGLKAIAPVAIAVAAVVLVVLGARQGWHWLRTSPRFAVTQVTIVGGAAGGHLYTTPARVVADTGLRLGVDNVFAVSTRTLEAQIARDPWIASVHVERELPGGLRVRVVEHSPIGLLVADGPYLLDERGRPFKRAATDLGEGAGLPVVTGIPRHLYREAPESAAAVALHAVAVVNRWNSGAVPGRTAIDDHGRPAAGEVNVSPKGLILYTAEGTVALRLGRVRQSDMSERLRRFDAAWSALSAEERASARVIYLDSNTRTDRVTARLADAR
jgi:cell division septal protein FtsQ